VHPIVRRIIISGNIVVTLLGVVSRVTAQSVPPPGVVLPPDAPDTVEQTIPTPAESPTPLPTTPSTPLTEPSLQVPLPSPSASPSPSDIGFYVNQIEVLGNTVLQAEIANIVQPFENREVTFEELIELRSTITQLYIDNGYVTSGAFLPNNQDLTSGVVQIQVVEGELEQINISGLTRLQDGYVRSRLNLAATRPLSRQRLEEALQLLQLDPLLEQVNAELTAGSSPGRNALEVNLREASAFHTGIFTDNYQSPSIGSEQAGVSISHDNLLGWGDRFNGQFGITAGLNLYDVSYVVPVNPRNGTINLRYSNNDSNIIEEDFEDLGIRSEAQTISVGIRQPLYRTPSNEFALGLALDLRQSQTFILDDIPFSFSEGAENGESRVTVIRFSQDWLNRGRTRVLAARSQFSIGLDAFDSTVNNTGTDGRFFSWLGQFQWVQQVSSRVLILARVNAQLTPDSLLSLERVGIGGVDTVRGYAQNQLVADNGIWSSVEARIPLTSDSGRLQLIPFLEIGHAWNNQTPDPDPATLASIGMGLRWLVTPELDLRLDYGIPFIRVNNQGNSLQDQGIYFSLRYQPF
jgi:hemolysin activation/secretion protein